MMKFFRLVDNKPVVEPELLGIKEFATIITRDKTKDKSKSIKELMYIYYIADYKTPYVNKDTREEKVKIELGFDEGWIADKAITDAIDKYVELQKTESVRFVIGLREAIDQSAELVEDLTQKMKETEDEIARTELFDIIMKIADKAPKSINALEELEKKLLTEEEKETGSRGRRIKMFEKKSSIENL